MRVIVVGCNGFIGKALIKHLDTLKIARIGISKEEFNLLETSTSNKLNKVLRNGDQIVFTSAIAPAKSPADLQKTIKMSDVFCQSLGGIDTQQVVLISSDSVYGDKSGLINEYSPCDPNSFHGMAQLSREIIFKNAKIGNLAILRLCSVYGPGDTHNGYGPNRFVNQIKNFESIKVFGQGINIRDHIYIADVVDLITKSLMSKTAGILNVVSGESYTFHEVAEKCIQVFNPDSNLEFIGNEGEVIIKNFDHSKICKIFPDFKAKNLDSGLSFWKSQVH